MLPQLRRHTSYHDSNWFAMVCLAQASGAGALTRYQSELLEILGVARCVIVALEVMKHVPSTV